PAGPADREDLMNRLEINISKIVVETAYDKERTPMQVQKLLREAFKKFAERFESSPFARRDILCDLVFERLRMPQWAPDLLFSPMGAEKLADELYAQLVRGIK